MSAFRPSGGGGGLTPAQFDSLVSDPELASSRDVLLAEIAAKSAGTSGSVTQAHEELRYVLAAMLNRGRAIDPYDPNTIDNLGQAIDMTARGVSGIVTGENPVSITEFDKSSIADMTRSALEPAIQGAGVQRGEVRMFASNPGPGFTRLSGVGVPAGLYGVGQQIVVPYTAGASDVQAAVLAAFRRASDGAGATYAVSNGVSNLFRRFNEDTMAWEDLPSIPLASNHSADNLICLGDAAYVFGSTLTATLTAASYRFSAGTTSWASIAARPFARSTLAALKTENRILLAGGSTSSNQNSAAVQLDAVRWYDPVANSYEAKSALPIKMSGGFSTGLTDGRVVLFPGYATTDGATVSNRKNIVYSPGTDSCVVLDDLPAAAQSRAASWVYERAPGEIVYVPNYTTAGPRALLLIVDAPAGAQWQPLDFPAVDSQAMPANSSNVCSFDTSTSGMQFGALSQASTYLFGLTYAGVVTPGASSLAYYQKD